MGLGEETAPEPQPPAIDRQALATPAPVVPAAPRRPDIKPLVSRQAQTSATVPLPPVKLRQDRRVAEARRAPLPLVASRGPKSSEAGPRRPAAPAAGVVVAGIEPIVAPRFTPSPSVAKPAEAAVPVAAAVPGPVAQPARSISQIDFLLPLLEQPPPPVIAVPAPPRLDAMPPAFDVIATLLLAAPPRH